MRWIDSDSVEENGSRGWWKRKHMRMEQELETRTGASETARTLPTLPSALGSDSDNPATHGQVNTDGMDGEGRLPAADLSIRPIRSSLRLWGWALDGRETVLLSSRHTKHQMRPSSFRFPAKLWPRQKGTLILYLLCCLRFHSNWMDLRIPCCPWIGIVGFEKFPYFFYFEIEFWKLLRMLRNLIWRQWMTDL